MNILITGSNGSLGQELTKELLKYNHTIYTTSRHKALPNEKNHITVDLLEDNAVSKIKHYINNKPLDVIINNAAYLCKKKILRNTRKRYR